MNRSQEFGIGTNSPTPQSDSSRTSLPHVRYGREGEEYKMNLTQEYRFWFRCHAGDSPGSFTHSN